MAVSNTAPEFINLALEFLTFARIASALEGGAVGHLLFSESTADVEVAGEGVSDGVQGEGGPKEL